MYYGQSVDGSAQVSTSDGSTPTGIIIFYDGPTSICVLTIAPGATCPDSAGEGLPAGTHNLTAAYSGDASHAPSTSNTATITVLKAPTAAALTSSNNPATAGQNITLTATVQGAHAAPVGNVAFYDGATLLATAALNQNGTSIFTTSSLAPGTHSLSAVFSGTPNFEEVTSATLNQQIQPSTSAPAGPVSFSIDVDSVSVQAGQSVTIPITFSNGNFNLTCGNLPDEATCLTPATGGAGKNALMLKTSAPRDCGATTPYGIASMPYTAPLAAGLLVFFAPRRRRLGTLLAVFIGACSGVMTGCGAGNCTDLGTRPGTYKMTVTGTSTGTTPTSVSREIVVKVTI
jgi:hypothetical protein